MSGREGCDSMLDAPVVSVNAVSAGRAKLLGKLGVRSVRDLLTTYPNRYIDLGRVTSVAQAPIGETVTVVGYIDEVKAKQPRPRLHILEAAQIGRAHV